MQLHHMVSEKETRRVSQLAVRLRRLNSHSPHSPAHQPSITRTKPNNSVEEVKSITFSSTENLNPVTLFFLLSRDPLA